MKLLDYVLTVIEVAFGVLLLPIQLFFMAVTVILGGVTILVGLIPILALLVLLGMF